MSDAIEETRAELDEGWAGCTCDTTWEPHEDYPQPCKCNQPHGQTKRQSLSETLCSVAIGYVVAVVSQVLIFPLFDVTLTLSENFTVAAYFTAVSIVRGYIVRRMFNKMER